MKENYTKHIIIWLLKRSDKKKSEKHMEKKDIVYQGTKIRWKISYGNNAN